MNEHDRVAVEACADAGWITMGVGDGDGQNFVHGPPEAIYRAQKLVLRGELLRELTPAIALNLLETLHAAERAIHLEPEDEAAIKVLRRLLESCGGKTKPVQPRMWEEVATQDMGLQILRPSPHQVQFRQDGKVVADWWPSKGTTLAEGQRGPICKTGEDVLAWLRRR